MADELFQLDEGETGFADEVDLAVSHLMEEKPDNEITVQDRMGYIGGSDAAAVCGLSPWTSTFELFLEKTGQRKSGFVEGERMRWGNILEAIIAQEYAEQTGSKIRRVNKLIRHKDYRFIGVHIDRRVLNVNVVLECKSAGVDQAHKWGEPGTDEVPEYYIPQAQHTMLATGADRVDIAVLIGGNTYRIYELPRDPEYIEYLLKLEMDFWKRVVDNNPPPIEGEDDAKAAWPRTREGDVDGDGESYRAWVQLHEVNAEVKKLEDRQSELKGIMMERIKAKGDTLLYEGTKLATWKQQKGRKTIDSKKLEANYPEAYAACKKEGNPHRVFRLAKRG